MTKPPSYWTFVWKEKTNRKFLLYGLAACILQFIVFKLLYPFPDCFNDSYWYVHAAVHQLDISIWPIGYSKFLAAFHSLTSSHIALIAFQYFLFQLAAMHFYFTLLYFFNIRPWISNSIFVFIVSSPLTLYISNTIASDTLFGALTLLWLGELIWIVFRPRIQHLVVGGVLLFLCFTLRNTAYYYPFIAALAIVLSHQRIWKKIAGIAFPILLLIPFINFTKNAAYNLTGTRTFSLLTGWQLANNVLYFYDHIHVDSIELPTAASREVNQLALTFFHRSSPLEYRLFLNSTDGNVYIINYQSPLKRYFVGLQKGIDHPDMVQLWGRASVDFEPFGRSVILHHPWEYFRYFVLMNAGYYLLPQLSDLKTYNNNRDEVEPLIANWFHYPATGVTSVSKDIQGYLFIYQVFFFLLHIYFVGVAFLIIVKARVIQFPRRTVFLYCLLTTYLSLNAVFSASVTINLLRYQFIPMYVLLLTNLLLTENIFRLYAEKSKPKLTEVTYNPTPL